MRFSIACSHRPWFLGLGARSVLSPFVLGALWTKDHGTDQDPSTKDQGLTATPNYKLR